MKAKTIYDLELHESIIVKVETIGPSEKYAPLYPYIWQVTRVATGWIYQNASSNITQHEGYFIPLTTFQNNII